MTDIEYFDKRIKSIEGTIEDMKRPGMCHLNEAYWERRHKYERELDDLRFKRAVIVQLESQCRPQT